MTAISWRKDGKLLNGSVYQQSQLILDTGTAVYDNNLTITQSDVEVSGLYSCTVSNSRGNSSAELSVPGKCLSWERWREKCVIGSITTPHVWLNIHSYAMICEVTNYIFLYGFLVSTPALYLHVFSPLARPNWYHLGGKTFWAKIFQCQ